MQKFSATEFEMRVFITRDIHEQLYFWMLIKLFIVIPDGQTTPV